MLKKCLGIFLFFLFFIAPIKIFATTSSAGFVPSNIWYSKDAPEEGDKIKIYTLIFNPDTRELSGTVDFFDQTVLLGKKDFTVIGKGVKDISIDWTVTVGDHKILGKIENAKFLISKGQYEQIILTKSETEENSLTVSKKIIPKTTDTNSTDSITNIENIVAEKTPNFIAKPITLVANKIEELRSNLSATTENSKEKTKKEIEIINTDKTSIKAQSGASAIQKPVKYIGLFFFTIASFIFNNKFIFYGILVLLLFFIIRFIWRFIFI